MQLQRFQRTISSWGPTILRIGFGLMLMAHGSQKLFGLFDGPGIGGFASYLAKLDVPSPVLGACLSGLAEFGGGLLLLVGFYVRLAAIPIMVNMIVGARLVHWKNGFFIQNNGFEYTAMIVVSMLALLVMGGGAMSLDERFSGGGLGGGRR